MIEMADEVRRAWSELERVRAALRDVEWSGAAITGYDGYRTPCCPACGGFKPGASVEWPRDYKPSDWDHTADCALVAALAPSTDHVR